MDELLAPFIGVYTFAGFVLEDDSIDIAILTSKNPKKPDLALYINKNTYNRETFIYIIVEEASEIL